MAGARTALFWSHLQNGKVAIDDMKESTGRRFFVHSTDGTDNTAHGDTPDAPFATIDYAVGKCTASVGDIIYVMPGHTETVGSAAALDFDVAGIKVIGVGWGDNRPIVNLTATDSTVECNADDMWIENIRFKGSIADLVVGVDVKTGCDNLTFKNCQFGGAAASTEMLIAVTIEATNDHITFDGCYFKEPTGGDSTAAIITEGAFTNLLIQNCLFWGDWSTAVLDLDAAAVTGDALIVRDCDFYNSDVSAALCCTLADSTAGHFIRCTYGIGLSNTPPIPANDDGASTGIECYGTEGAAKAGALWPFGATTNYGS